MQPCNKKVSQTLAIGSLFLAIAVLLGAFGAHAIKDRLDPKLFMTYQVGVTYQYYHAFGLLFIGFLEHIRPALNFKSSKWCFAIGILIFSFNCYLYSLTQIKAFAMIIPIGGTMFITGWSLICLKLLKDRK